MDVYIYTEGTRKVKGEDQVYLAPLAELEDFDTIDAALEALVDEAPELLGTEFVIFTQQPEYVTVGEPTARYAFSRRNGSGAVVEAEEEVVYEDEVEPEEEEEVVVATPARKRAPAAKKRPAKKPAAKKRPAAKAAARGARAGTRTGSSKRTPFTKNAASAE